jgi:hypothetical protein
MESTDRQQEFGGTQQQRPFLKQHAIIPSILQQHSQLKENQSRQVGNTNGAFTSKPFSRT